eukprot:GHVN01069831.1.p1 GENE.GHVN01069831.1~~GHVN01069831.1.p1  ORF type:complete len:126 (+),score=16.00 GHVN01069831.1:465-842(+)
MFNYMTNIDLVAPLEEKTIEATGHDINDLLFHFLDELLFLYGSEYFICNVVEITHLEVESFSITATGYGSKFDPKKNSQGTEIKAITMHEMRILCDQLPTNREAEGNSISSARTSRSEVYVLVDI